MYIVQDYSLAVIFCVVTMLCWGSWGNTQKLASKTWRYEFFYWDYVIGVLLFSLISGFTLGSIGTEGRSFLPDLAQANLASLGSAFLGGIIFNAANILLSAAIAICGLSVAFPVGIGLALVLGVLVNYFGAAKGEPLYIFIGVALITVDEKAEKLYLTAEDYRAAQEAAAASKAPPQPEPATEKTDDVPLNLETARRFAAVLQQEKQLMQDAQGREELDHMQTTTTAICDWLEAHPESLPKARRFAEYYIPTTLKLLHTYNDVQGQQGENAETIRRDIAGILHTLNQAYDTLYDTLLSDVAMDVSSEIAALQGMLANDGLTGGNFE